MKTIGQIKRCTLLMNIDLYVVQGIMKFFTHKLSKHLGAHAKKWSNRQCNSSSILFCTSCSRLHVYSFSFCLSFFSLFFPVSHSPFFVYFFSSLCNITLILTTQEAASAIANCSRVMIKHHGTLTNINSFISTWIVKYLTLCLASIICGATLMWKQSKSNKC